MSELEALADEIGVLLSRKEAVEKMIDDRKDRLSFLLRQIGETKIVAKYASGGFQQRTEYRVKDVDGLARLFTTRELACAASVHKAFVEAARAAGIPIDTVIEATSDSSLVLRRDSDVAREIVAREKLALEAEIATLTYQFVETRRLSSHVTI